MDRSRASSGDSWVCRTKDMVHGRHLHRSLYRVSRLLLTSGMRYAYPLQAQVPAAFVSCLVFWSFHPRGPFWLVFVCELSPSDLGTLSTCSRLFVFCLLSFVLSFSFIYSFSSGRAFGTDVSSLFRLFSLSLPLFCLITPCRGWWMAEWRTEDGKNETTEYVVSQR